MMPGSDHDAGRLAFHDGACCRCAATADLLRFSELGKAVCPACYPQLLRGRIEATVRRFRMIPRRARVAVAVSGGGDSGALLHALAHLRGRLNFVLNAVHVDMGLGQYSEQSLAVCQEQARMTGVELVVDRVADYGVRVEALRDWPVCAVCGAVRRSILPRLARRIGADVICTGHTLDDQLQFMLKNILAGRPASPPPLRPATQGWPAKAKPLIQIPDRATQAYVRLVGLPVVQIPCPHFAPQSHRLKEVFALLEELAPMGKLQLWHTLRRVMAPDAAEYEQGACEQCGEPTSMGLCPLCRLRAAQATERP